MKKTLVSAITAALVVGAASTTFAAANPFSDVPADSWAYNAVVTLANDGVIDGFPNGTFQGNKNMTRYEMAQIIARAMAKENMSKADKALVEKLAVEFSSELNNLGVRVSNLEAKSDNVKLNGEVRYRYEATSYSKDTEAQYHDSNVLFRLDPTADLGNGWKAHARLDAELNAAQDQGKTAVELKRAYVEGPLFGSTVTAGKLPVILGNGLVFDADISGAKVVATKGDLAVTGVAGRYNMEEIQGIIAEYFNMPKEDHPNDATADFYAGQVNYTLNDNVSLNAGYYSLNNFYTTKVEKSDQAAWFAGVDAKLANNLRLSGEYAKADKDINEPEIDNQYKKAYSVQVDYKAADAKDAGSWGAYVGYRYLGFPVLKATYDDAISSTKGMVYGVDYVPAKNVLASVKYFNGKVIDENNDKVKKVFGQVEFLF